MWEAIMLARGQPNAAALFLKEQYNTFLKEQYNTKKEKDNSTPEKSARCVCVFVCSKLTKLIN